MSIFNKKVLSTIVYYSLVVLAIASAGFFVFALIVKDIPLWAKIVYYVWVGLLIGAVVFDIVCTNTHEAKTISGFIIYVLSVLCVAMTIILYCMKATSTGLPVDLFNLYLSTAIISFMTTGYTIATWCVGEALVEHASAEESIEK